MQFLSSTSINIGEMFRNLWEASGLAQGGWQNYVMLLVSFVLMYLAIVKKFEPLLLLPIAFGMFIINIPGASNIIWGRYNTPDLALALGQNDDGTLEYAGVYFSDLLDKTIYVREGFLNGDIVSVYESFDALKNGTVTTLSVVDFNALYVLQGYVAGSVTDTGTVFKSAEILMSHAYMDVTNRGLLWYLYFGVENVIYPPLIFMGIGAMTDFGPMIANPKSMLIGAAAQFGVFLTFIGAVLLGFDAAAAASIGIIGGADGPTAIYLTQALSSFTNEDLLATIAIAAYSYMALIPIIQKPIMKLLTTKKERSIKMKQLREVSKLEKIIFPAADDARRRTLAPGCDSFAWHVDARQSHEGERRRRKAFLPGAERSHEYDHDLPRRLRGQQGDRHDVSAVADPVYHRARFVRFLLRHGGRIADGEAHEQDFRRKDQSAHRFRGRVGCSYGSAYLGGCRKGRGSEQPFADARHGAECGRRDRFCYCCRILARLLRRLMSESRNWRRAISYRINLEICYG